MKNKIYSNIERLTYFINSINDSTNISFDNFKNGKIVDYQIIEFYNYNIPLFHLKFNNKTIIITLLYIDEIRCIINNILSFNSALDIKLNSYITHKIYGKGKIIEIDKEYVSILFNNNTRKFPISNINCNFFRKYRENDILEIINLDCTFRDITKDKTNYISNFIEFISHDNILIKKTYYGSLYNNELTFCQLIFSD